MSKCKDPKSRQYMKSLDISSLQENKKSGCIVKNKMPVTRSQTKLNSAGAKAPTTPHSVASKTSKDVSNLKSKIRAPTTKKLTKSTVSDSTKTPVKLFTPSTKSRATLSNLAPSNLKNATNKKIANTENNLKNQIRAPTPKNLSKPPMSISTKTPMKLFTPTTTIRNTPSNLATKLMKNPVTKRMLRTADINNKNQNKENLYIKKIPASNIVSSRRSSIGPERKSLPVGVTLSRISSCRTHNDATATTPSSCCAIPARSIECQAKLHRKAVDASCQTPVLQQTRSYADATTCTSTPSSSDDPAIASSPCDTTTFSTTVSTCTSTDFPPATTTVACVQTDSPCTTMSFCQTEPPPVPAPLLHCQVQTDPIPPPPVKTICDFSSCSDEKRKLCDDKMKAAKQFAIECQTFQLSSEQHQSTCQQLKCQLEHLQSQLKESMNKNSSLEQEIQKLTNMTPKFLRNEIESLNDVIQMRNKKTQEQLQIIDSLDNKLISTEKSKVLIQQKLENTEEILFQKDKISRQLSDSIIDLESQNRLMNKKNEVLSFQLNMCRCQVGSPHRRLTGKLKPDLNCNTNSPAIIVPPTFGSPSAILKSANVQI